MPSSWSASLRFELQFTGENINLWGDKLNAVLNHADYAIAGWLTKALSGNYSLTTANAADDEARAAMLKFTGAGPFTVTIPAVSKNYAVWNACSAAVTITTGSGTTVAVAAGEVCQVICDGTNVKRIAPIDYAGLRLQNLGDPTGAQDAATKAYVDAQSFAAAGGNLPGQPGNAGKFLKTNGSVASWAQLTPADMDFSGGLSISAGVTFSGGITMDGSIKQTLHAVAALDINVANEWHSKSISTNSTFTFSGNTASKCYGFVLWLTISSAAVPTWPGAVKWGGSVAPVLGNGDHVLTFVTKDGGTTWVGSVYAKAYG